MKTCKKGQNETNSNPEDLQSSVSVITLSINETHQKEIVRMEFKAFT